MKKFSLLLILAICFINFSVTEGQQTNQGNIMVGVSSGIHFMGELSTGSDFMNLGFGSVKMKSNASGFEEPDPIKGTSFGLLPVVGYFVMDNLAVGLDLTVALNSHKEKDEEGDYKESCTTFLGGPFVRYYFPVNNLLPFVTVNALFGSSNDKEEWGGETEEYKTGLTSFGGGVGLAIPLGEKVTFDVIAGYNSITAKPKEDNEDDYRYVMGTFGFKFGFVIYLGGE